MKVLIVGSGGREAAMAWKVKEEGHELLACPGSAGMALYGARCFPEEEPLAVAEREMADLTIIGPEAPLADGLVDRFLEAGLAVFGPTKHAAQLESSKAFAKAFMRRYGLPTARYQVTHSTEQAFKAVSELFRNGVVLKASGLAAGKGVIVCETEEQAHDAIDKILNEQAFGKTELVVEERMYGREVSVMCFSDGRRLVPMLPAQDHKRLKEGDQGPNTGGMGAFAPAEDVPGLDRLVAAIERALDEEALNFKGILYLGLMLTTTGPKLLEFNCRFGDPEAQVLLPLMDFSFTEACLACVEGRLSWEMVRWKEAHAATVVLAAENYPESPVKGVALPEFERIAQPFFVAGAKKAAGRWETAGGRVLNAVGLGNSREQALTAAYDKVEELRFSGAQWRRDIGRATLPLDVGRSD